VVREELNEALADHSGRADDTDLESLRGHGSGT
jgi:hypothetical protein